MIRKIMFTSALALLLVILSACAPQTETVLPDAEANAEDTSASNESTIDSGEMAEMGAMDMEPAPGIPAGMAFAEGKEIRFVHTEVSDEGVAGLLTDMMDSPVLYVPSLAEAPESMLALVYVFNNGIAGMGPLGYQPDVFDNPPGTDGYTTLRKIVFVTWNDETTARVLMSASEVISAEDDGEIALEESNIVVNMPFVVWDAGSR